MYLIVIIFFKNISQIYINDFINLKGTQTKTLIQLFIYF